MRFFENYKRLLIPAALFLLGLLLGAALTYLPKPKITEAPKSTKESVAAIAGKTGPKLGVVLMNEEGHILMAVNADSEGNFRFTGVPVREGGTTLRLRAVARGMRASAPARLTIARDTAAPSLAVNKAAGETVTGTNYLISGKAEPGSSITVNGVKTAVADDGSWSATIALTPGTNTIAVTATDAAGNSTTVTHVVTYAPSAEGSQTGTATTTRESASYSEGSQPPSEEAAGATTSTAPSGDVTTPGTSNSAASQTQQPPPQPTSIVVTASSANLSPNARSTQQIYAKVTTNLGTPATDAVTTGIAHYRTGDVTYAFAHAGNGNYVATFKLGENAVSDYTVFIDVTAVWRGLSATGRTSFTPR